MICIDCNISFPQQNTTSCFGCVAIAGSQESGRQYGGLFAVLPLATDQDQVALISSERLDPDFNRLSCLPTFHMKDTWRLSQKQFRSNPKPIWCNQFPRDWTNCCVEHALAARQQASTHAIKDEDYERDNKNHRKDSDYVCLMPVFGRLSISLLYQFNYYYHYIYMYTYILYKYQ